MAFGQADGLGQFLDRGELSRLHAPPPAPCPADGAQDVRVLRPILARAVIGGRHDLGPPVFLAQLQGIDLFPDLVGDDGVVLARIGLALVDRLATIDAIAEPPSSPGSKPDNVPLRSTPERSAPLGAASSATA